MCDAVLEIGVVVFGLNAQEKTVEKRSYRMCWVARR